MKKNKGYSLAVLVITIAVILILVATAITSYINSKEEKDIANFIADIRMLEDNIKEYYSDTGVLPSGEQIMSMPLDMKNQLSDNDNDIYYNIDIAKLEGIHLNRPNASYVFNEQSLTVYDINGIEYKNFLYFTLTRELMGTLDRYETKDEEIVVIGNPTIWSSNARFRIILPRQANLTGWTFKWDYGPKGVEHFLTMGQSFNYGDILVAKKNGVYSVYIKDNLGNETVKNVVISKIDSYSPKYVYKSGVIGLEDAQTGIAEVRYKVKTSGIIDLKTYLINGKGDTIQQLNEDIVIYEENKKLIIDEWNDYVEQYDNEDTSSLTPEELEIRDQEYALKENEMMRGIQTLNQQYIHITNPSNQYVIYVEDNAGNALAILPKENMTINLELLCNSLKVSSNETVSKIVSGDDITVSNLINSINRQLSVLDNIDIACFTNISLIDTAIIGIADIKTSLTSMAQTANRCSNGEITPAQAVTELTNYLQAISNKANSVSYGGKILLDGTLMGANNAVRVILGGFTSPQGEVYYEINSMTPAGLSTDGVAFHISMADETSINKTIVEISNALAKVFDEQAKLEALKVRFNNVKNYSIFLKTTVNNALISIEGLDTPIRYESIKTIIYSKIESMIEDLIITRIQDMKTIATQAKTEPNQDNRNKMQYQINQLIEEINRVARYASIGNVKTLDGTYSGVINMSANSLGLFIVTVLTNEEATTSLTAINNALAIIQNQISML